jgi:hypothetical protein
MGHMPCLLGWFFREACVAWGQLCLSLSLTRKGYVICKLVNHNLQLAVKGDRKYLATAGKAHTFMCKIIFLYAQPIAALVKGKKNAS